MKTYFTTYGLNNKRETLATARSTSFALSLPLVVIDYSHDLARLYKDAREGRFREIKEQALQRNIVACLLYSENKESASFRKKGKNTRQKKM